MAIVENRIAAKASTPVAAGRIRPGTKVPTKTCRASPDAMRILKEGRLAGKKTRFIEAEITAATKIKHPLYPRNSPFFRVLRDDFAHSPKVVESLLDLYGTDEDGEQVLAGFPVVFPGDTVSSFIRDRFESSHGAADLRKWSAEGGDGKRYCMALPKLPAAGASRVKQLMRVAEVQGACEPNACASYGAGQCKYKASIQFYIPGVATTLPFEMATGSEIATGETWQALKRIEELLGTIPKAWKGQPLFALRKRQAERSYIDEQGQPAKGLQWVPWLDTNVDLAEILLELEATGKLLPAAMVEQKSSEQAPKVDDVPTLDLARQMYRNAFNSVFPTRGKDRSEASEFLSTVGALLACDLNWTEQPAVLAWLSKNLRAVLSEPQYVKGLIPSWRQEIGLS
jgi:hypothetical protein